MILRRISTPSRHGLPLFSRHFSATPSFSGGNALQGGSYPYPLWFHPEGTVMAVSFLGPSDVPGKELRKEGIIGWVKGDTETPDLKPGNFQTNPTFEDVLHEVVKENIDEDEGIKALALHQKIGHLNINDQRTYTSWGRVSDPEDILGTVQLDDGSMVPGSYQRMPTHRIVSSNGLFQLSEFLHSKLVDRLQEK